MVRLDLFAFAVAPGIAGQLLNVFGFGFLLGLTAAPWGWRQLDASDELPLPNITNPTEIKTALSFGGLYALILMLSAWLQDVAGNSGLYLLALASGLTDVDAITLSSLRMFSMDKLSAAQTVTAIVLSTLSNLALKTGLVVVIGGTALARRTLPGLAAIAVGMIGGLLLV